jgi:phosphate transport system permease protein
MLWGAAHKCLYAPPPVSSLASQPVTPSHARLIRLNRVDARASRLLRWLALIGAAIVFLALIAIAYQVINGASLAIGRYGLSFVGRTRFDVTAQRFGALPMLAGTLVTSVCSLVVATFLGVAIGLLLSLMAPRKVAGVVGPLVEMLAAIPSVVIGLVGIALIAPFVLNDLEGWLHSAFGFIPLFGTPGTVGNSVFTASLVLVIMVVPIIAALTRDLFLTVPQELRDGAEALGATRWEMIRGVVLPTTQSGIVAACVLGFGRAIGEAIAVTQVIGNNTTFSSNLFERGDTLASLIANQYLAPVNALQTSSLFYCGLILLVMGLVTNLLARYISNHYGRAR